MSDNLMFFTKDSQLINTNTKESDEIFSVSDIANAIKYILEEKYSVVKIRGEISKVSQPMSGHIYFDICDAQAILSCVVWKGYAKFLKEKPKQGLEVVLTGKISTFSMQSKYQCIVHSIEACHSGKGALMLLLEKRKQKLLAEGFFDKKYKKKLPFLPTRIGIITSPSGAVLHDILHRLHERFPTHVMLYPVSVQSQITPTSVQNAICYFSKLEGHRRLDVIIIARGGGSFEDLFYFNDEDLVKAVALCPIPIVSAIGHETDTTLIDYAASLRAPTPTAAAELVSPVREECIYMLHVLYKRLYMSFTNIYSMLLQKFDFINKQFSSCFFQFIEGKIFLLHKYTARLKIFSPRTLFFSQLQKVKELDKNIHYLFNFILKENIHTLEMSVNILESCNHQHVLKRGFSIVKQHSQYISHSKDIDHKKDICIEFYDHDCVKIKLYTCEKIM